MSVSAERKPRSATPETSARESASEAIAGPSSGLLKICDLEPGKDLARERARVLVERARARLSRLPEGPARKALHALTEFVLERRW